MTNELEKQFFDTFGIEPKCEDACELGDEYWNNEHLANEYGVFDNYMEAKGCPINKDGCTDNCRHAYTKEVYPQITDRILLELICILSQHFSWEEGNWFIERTTIDELKEWLLEVFIEIDKIGLSKIIKYKVRTLFEEG